ncbi:MAG: beta-lactamase family protein [Tatlockia sp.]|nr:beta-lactamase family protein [Tatlockia sp.]
MKLRLTAAIMLFFFSSICLSEGNYQNTIKEAQTSAQTFIKQKKGTAITIAVFNPDQIIWSQAFGLTDPTSGQPVNSSTMFGIGSVSKMVATIALMKLVDQHQIKLDTPIINYLPKFKMASPEYKDITPRMLINHSAGFPGTDYRNAILRSPYPNYLNQMLETLSHSRLKTPPGYMNVYCNDCFSLVEALIKEVTGKSYVDFVQEEVFSPLEMINTTYPIHPLPKNSYAKAYVNGIVRPQEYVNCFAAGGVYSTAEDIAHIGMMLLKEGNYGTTRILSKNSIEEMAKNQTLGSFNPVPSKTLSYGLGWDTVEQPGLYAVGFDGWAKGGDSNDYGAMLIISPKAQLGIIVLGVSNFGSENAKIIAERVLLKALTENKPSSKKLPGKQSPSFSPSAVSEADKQEYGASEFLLKFQKESQDSFAASVFSDKGWIRTSTLNLQNNGWFTNEKEPQVTIRMIDAVALGKPSQYIIKRAPAGNGHYLDYTLLAQKLPTQKPFSPAWQSRINTTWLVVNAHPDELIWNGEDPRLVLKPLPSNLIAVRAPAGSTFQVVDPSVSDDNAAMMLVIPQLNGRDLNNLDVLSVEKSEWLRFGSYLHQPLSVVQEIPLNESTTITIGPEGYAKWLSIASNTQTQISIDTESNWHFYDAEFKTLAYGKGKETKLIPAGKGSTYLTVFGEPGQKINLLVRPVSK